MNDASWRNVGKRIRKLRKDNHLTLKQLAIGCNLSPNAVSLVERGEVAPTVITLCKIANALGAPASSFFQEVCPTEVILTRAVDGQARTRPESAFQLLTGSGVAIPASAREGAACSLSGQMTQMVLCVCGLIEYEIDDQCHLLSPGDSLTFNGEAYHRWRNLGSETGIAVMVLAPSRALKIQEHP